MYAPFVCGEVDRRWIYNKRIGVPVHGTHISWNYVLVLLERESVVGAVGDVWIMYE
jgi:hypothetical protein